MEKRYRLLSDDSGHDYFIRVDQVDLFEAWVESFEEDPDAETKYTGPDFNDSRIDGRFTFTDPRND
jgi:hypothetical protein